MTSASPAIEQPAKPTGGALFKASCQFVLTNGRKVLAIAVTPLIISAIVNLGAALAVREGFHPVAMEQLAGVLSIVPNAMLGVGVSRLVILGESADQAAVWSGAHTRFALFAVAWQLPLVVVVLGADPETAVESMGAAIILLGIAMLVLTIEVYPRLAIFLPAAAVDRPISLIEAWQRSHGYWMTILCSQILCVLASLVLVPLALAASFVAGATDGGDGSELLATFLTLFVAIPSQILMSGALAYAYLALEQRREPVVPAYGPIS